VPAGAGDPPAGRPRAERLCWHGGSGDDDGWVQAPIVVGVDGSESSLAALQWAIDQASCTGAALRAVTAWWFPNEPTPFGIIPDIPAPENQLDRVKTKLDEVLQEQVPSWGELRVTTEVIEGPAATVLTEASRHAALLVVGSRGRGLVAEVLLGSVSEYCVRHAACPVVVVRGVAERGGAPARETAPGRTSH
jgi:nucleotide-binding universal stress UspA family protein